MAVDRYVPEPVPDTGNPELQRYLAEELARIKLLGDQGWVSQAYGALAITSTNVNSVGTTPVKVTGYDQTRPDSGEINVEGDIVNGDLTVLEAGTYVVSAVLTADIDSGTAYSLFLYADGSPTGISGTLDSSNQTGVLQLVITALEDVVAGTVLSLFLTADLAASQYDIELLEFSIFRISEAR